MHQNQIKITLNNGRSVLPYIALLIGPLCLSLTGGCRHDSAPAEDGYQTVADDPRRNTEFARTKTHHAKELIKNGDWSGAEQALRQALDADVMFGIAHNELGKVYFHQSRLYLAAWEFQYAAKLMPNQPEPRNNLGLVLEAANRFDDAIKCYDEAIKSQPDNAEFIGNSARARIRRGDSDAQVKELLARLVERDTRTDWVNWARGRLSRMSPPGTRE